MATINIWKFQCSSASRKFLNLRRQTKSPTPHRVSVLFSEPKIPQWEQVRRTLRAPAGFSALQRAENSSIPVRRSAPSLFSGFQCSSASRKFLNRGVSAARSRRAACFSALQRAENSSIRCCDAQRTPRARRFSALQRAENSSIANVQAVRIVAHTVSVLFSEPKIPQFVRPN